MKPTFCGQTLLLAIAIVMNSCKATGQEYSPDVLKIAKRIGETRYKGWRYGSSSQSNRVNCVLFVGTVVEDLIARNLTKEERSAVFISNVRKDEDLKMLVQKEDSRIKGIQTALVEMGIGLPVTVQEVQAGDFIQYWYQDKQGQQLGHSAVVESVQRSGTNVFVKIYGAHQSLNGVGTARFDLNLTDPTKRVYLVRFRSLTSPKK